MRITAVLTTGLLIVCSHQAAATTVEQRARERNAELQQQYRAQRYQEHKRRRTHPVQQRGTVPPGLSQILTRTFDYHSNVPSTMDVRQLKDGCEQRDCVQSIDRPRFDSVYNIHYLQDRDLLMVVEHGGIRRAYPHKVLNLREVVNDQYDATAVVVSYYPLTGAGTAFVAAVDGLQTEFGVSGMLHNSSRILYDRRTNNLWQQLSGDAIVGNAAGDRLRALPVRTLSWASLKTHCPDAQVLRVDPDEVARLRETDDQYLNYRRSSRIYFPVQNKDRTLHPKQLVHGLEHNSVALAVADSYLRKHRSLRYDFDGEAVHISLNPDGSITAVTQDSGAPLAITRLYWFAWYSFHTDTEMVM